MSLVSQAKKDIERITSTLSEWAVDAVLIKPNGDEFIIKAIHTKHHVSIGTDGLPVNAKNASIAFSEGNLQTGLSIRNAGGEVVLKNWRINVVDSTGIVKNYRITQWFPDEMIGLIVCILGDYGA